MNLFQEEYSIFPTNYQEILQRIRKIDPVKYGSTRNYLNGSVTYLSPYISRGIISTKFILSEVLNRGYNPSKIEKFIKELAWRDYWQQIAISKNTAINEDLKNAQTPRRTIMHTRLHTCTLHASSLLHVRCPLCNVVRM